MYKIAFDNQPRHGEPDTEGNSIILSQEKYEELPVFHGPNNFNAKDIVIKKGRFSEQIRHPQKSFPSISFSTNLKLNSENIIEEGGYVNDSISLIFVCIDEEKDFWISFNFYDLTTIEDTYGSTVSVSFPNHGPVYRVDEETKQAMRKYFGT